MTRHSFGSLIVAAIVSLQLPSWKAPSRVYAQAGTDAAANRDELQESSTEKAELTDKGRPREAASSGEAPPAVPFYLTVKNSEAWIVGRSRDKPEGKKGSDASHVAQGSPLAWQIARQALFITACEELGLISRDLMAGDNLPGSTKKLTSFEIIAGRKWNKDEQVNDNVIRIVAQGKESKAVWEMDMPMFSSPMDYRAFLIKFEELSRTEFVDVLRKTLAMDRANKRAATDVEENVMIEDKTTVDKWLDEMTFVAQFQAVRKLHSQMQANEASVAPLSNLVRAYANLGILTEHLLHPMHNVFKARSLLYAQRLVMQQPKDANSLYHRAYAFALCGLHKEALTDIEAAKALVQTKKAEGQVTPEWVPWIEMLCRCDRKGLENAAKQPESKQIVSLMWFIATDQGGSVDLAASVGIQAVEKLPECFRLFDGVCDMSGVANLHHFTVIPHQALAKGLYPGLRKLTDLPPSVKEKLPAEKGLLQKFIGDEDGADELTTRQNVITALKSEKLQPVTESAAAVEVDRNALSWTTLGCMIEEETFKQVAHRTRFLGWMLRVSPQEYVQVMEPLIGAHRFRPVLDLYSGNRSLAAQAVQQLRSNEFRKNWYFYGAPYCPRHVKHNDVLEMRAIDAMDDTANSINNMIAKHDSFAWRLAQVSPHSPYAKSILTFENNSLSVEELREIERSCADHPRVLGTLAWRHKSLDRFDDAERCWKQAVANDPRGGYANDLADFYLSQGKEDRWLETLDLVLEQPDNGLNHAKIRTTISKHFRTKRQWEKAAPYAETAANSYAEWAMEEAISVNEGRQDWEAVLRWRRARYERYGSGVWEWYQFAKRTGAGEPAELREVVYPQVREFVEELKEDNSMTFAIFYHLEHEPAKAIPAWKLVFGTAPYATNGLLLALTYDEMNDAENRDAVLAKVHEIWKQVDAKQPRGSRVIALGDAIVEDLATAKQDGKKAGFVEFDRKKLDEMYEQAAGPEKISFAYLVGRYCSLHGNDALAIEYWKRCMASAQLEHVCRTLAGAALVDRQISPSEYKDALHDPKLDVDRPRAEEQDAE